MILVILGLSFHRKYQERLRLSFKAFEGSLSKLIRGTFRI